MKVLVTGCQGQVGYYLKQQLASKPWSVLTLGRDELDITDRKMVADRVAEFKPDVIINSAAYTAVDRAESDEATAFSVNGDGPAYLAEAANNVGAAILHISTDYVFSGDKVGLYAEEERVDPQGVYGASKLAGENAVREKCPRHIILRTAWVFGEHGHNFVKTMLRLGKDRDVLGIVADQHGGPTFAGDIATALIRIVDYLSVGKDVSWGVYHFSGEPHVSWYQFAEAIFQAAVKESVLDKAPKLNAIATEDYPTPAKRPKNSKLDCEKMKLEFGVESSDWNQALQRIRYYC